MHTSADNYYWITLIQKEKSKYNGPGKGQNQGTVQVGNQIQMTSQEIHTEGKIQTPKT